MVDHPEPDDSWFTYQPTYPRLYGHISSEELVEWYDEWYLVPRSTMVQVKDRKDGLDPNLAD